MISLQKITEIFSKKKEAFSFGLDIGASSIKIVKLKISAEATEICDFYLEPISIDLSGALHKIQSSSVTIGVCGSSVIIRYINFPKMNENELKQALKFEAQKHIPFSITEVNLDGCILKPDIQDNKMLVLLAAVKKDYAASRLKVVESANLKVGLLDLDSLALINAFNFNYSTDEVSASTTVALLNIGAVFTSLNILEGGIPRLSRDIQIGGSNFTKKISDMLALDFKQAEEVKINPGPEKIKNVNSALESTLSNLAGEIRTSFDYYETQNASNVEKIFLSGGCSLHSGLAQMLAGLLGIEVVSWDPLKKISIASSVDAEKLKGVSAQFAVAVGLALRK